MNFRVRLDGSDALAPGFKTDPYWWDAAPRHNEPVRPLPSTTDVAIIGSGYTGLSAALTLARGGREVLILEQGPVGWGASSRNFGMLGRQYKRDSSIF
jgi:NADPH-dependent 2,4-dienoyl-CoA reductase/sulfur reductase-like enzyme